MAPCWLAENRGIRGRITTWSGNVPGRSVGGCWASWRERRRNLAAILETARESDGDRLRCKACGSFIPGVSKLKLSDILAVIRELRAVLPAQLEHEGLPPITVQVVAGGPIVPYTPDEG